MNAARSHPPAREPRRHKPQRAAPFRFLLLRADTRVSKIRHRRRTRREYARGNDDRYSNLFFFLASFLRLIVGISEFFPPFLSLDCEFCVIKLRDLYVTLSREKSKSFYLSNPSANGGGFRLLAGCSRASIFPWQVYTRYKGDVKRHVNYAQQEGRRKGGTRWSPMTRTREDT